MDIIVRAKLLHLNEYGTDASAIFALDSSDTQAVNMVTQFYNQCVKELAFAGINKFTTRVIAIGGIICNGDSYKNNQDKLSFFQKFIDTNTCSDTVILDIRIKEKDLVQSLDSNSHNILKFRIRGFVGGPSGPGISVKLI
jgi:nitrogenase subunit NifH